MIGIGIDTGGTYTDAVIYNLETQELLSSSKSLTTHQHLETGITNALDLLPFEALQKAEFLSLSTTLATNACVEGIGGRAKLIFIDVERKTVLEMYQKYGLPHPDEICFLEETNPFWKEELLSQISGFSEYDSIAIVQIFAQQKSARMEKKVRKILESKLTIPCICGHDLFQDLNVLKRGSSTLLNARLIPVIKNFIKAIQDALIQRNLDLPIVIVKSDGSLMSLDFTLLHPVETLLSGPAASIMAGTKLTSQKDALVVDMGGTTTDIAIIENHFPVTEKSGISVGEWKTFVKGLYIDTFGLGGDSAVRFAEEKLFLDNRRVIPLCILAKEYPQIIPELKELVEETSRPHIHYLHEFFVLLQDISSHPAYTEEEKAFCRNLEKGPVIYKKAAALMGKDVYGLHVERLEQDGIIMRSGLTPTDIMHLKGDFCKFNSEASGLGAAFAGICVGMDVSSLCDAVYDLVEKKLYCNLVRILLKHEQPSYGKYEGQPLFEKMIEDSYDCASKEAGTFCGQRFFTKAALIGLGAPTHIFLKRVAALLGTTAVLPEHAPVANALGAVMGNVSVTFSAEIKPIYTSAGISEYLVYGPDEVLHFEEYEDAKAAAIDQALLGAKKAAKAQGASDLTLSYDTQVSNPNILTDGLFLQENVIGKAIGRITIPTRA